MTALLIMSCAAIGYYLLPDVEQEFRFITPGSMVGTLVWLLATWGFSMYAGHFGSYNVTFGSIGGVVLLMTWFYITGFIFVMGGEINAILEAASDEGKASGARAPGEAPPPPSQRPSAMPPGAAKRAEVAAETPGGAAADRPELLRLPHRSRPTRPRKITRAERRRCSGSLAELSVDDLLGGVGVLLQRRAGGR